MDGIQILIGFFLAALIAFAGYRAGALTLDGAAGAVLVGGVTFGFGGWLPAVLLILFFVSSSALSRIGRSRKRDLSSAFAKTGQRDISQVLANGLMAATSSAIYGVTNETIWLAGLAGALAAVNADTWSTELGVLAHRSPRLITNGSRVEPGTSGGVTLEGTLAAVGGAALIAVVSGIATMDFLLGIGIVVGGVMGALVDSLLGASIQAMYYCPSCNKQTERHPTHTCGTDTYQIRGWSWMTNDVVNFIASMTGAIIAGIIWILAKG
ncbi:MAG: DUF92 domain-containing protein [Anaerolineales bacterium]|nr:DUF92 domain-containing protein [Anaerolineales bacterium]